MRSRALAVLATVIAAGVFAGSAFATVVTYFGPEWTMNGWQTAQTTGFANRDYNKIFRPAGPNVAVQYDNTSGGFIAGTSGTHNPVVLGPSGQLARALCGNLTGSTFAPTTCNTTT